MRNGRSGGIRTPGPLVPNQMRYQAALHSDEVFYPHSSYFSSLLRMQNQFYFVFFLISGGALLASQRQQQLRIWLHVKFSGRSTI